MQTLLYGVQPSLYGVQTSLYGVQTSLYGVQTSLYDVQTWPNFIIWCACFIILCVNFVIWCGFTLYGVLHHAPLYAVESSLRYVQTSLWSELLLSGEKVWWHRSNSAIYHHSANLGRFRYPSSSSRCRGVPNAFSRDSCQIESGWFHAMCRPKLFRSEWCLGLSPNKIYIVYYGTVCSLV